jgi:hypothetical protein
MRNGSRNVHTAPKVGADVATSRLMRSLEHSWQRDKHALSLLPEFFTTEEAQKAWMYKRVDTTHARIRLLSLAGYVELVTVKTHANPSGNGGQRTYTWRKVAIQ